MFPGKTNKGCVHLAASLIFYSLMQYGYPAYVPKRFRICRHIYGSLRTYLLDYLEADRADLWGTSDRFYLETLHGLTGLRILSGCCWNCSFFVLSFAFVGKHLVSRRRQFVFHGGIFQIWNCYEWGLAEAHTQTFPKTIHIPAPAVFGQLTGNESVFVASCIFS